MAAQLLRHQTADSSAERRAPTTTDDRRPTADGRRGEEGESDGSRESREEEDEDEGEERGVPRSSEDRGCPMPRRCWCAGGWGLARGWQLAIGGWGLVGGRGLRAVRLLAAGCWVLGAGGLGGWGAGGC
jgi:hypothetical protein